VTLHRIATIVRARYMSGAYTDARLELSPAAWRACRQFFAPSQPPGPAYFGGLVGELVGIPVVENPRLPDGG